MAIEFAVNSTSKRGRRTGFCGPVVVSFDAELEATVGNLAQRLRRKFRVGFEPDRTQFKRDGLATFRRNLPHSERGWPCSPAVTHALRLRARKKPGLRFIGFACHFCHPSHRLQPARRFAHASTAVEKNASSQTSDFRRESVRHVEALTPNRSLLN